MLQRPQVRVWGIPEQMLHFTPEQALEIDKNVFVSCLRGASSGTAPGSGECTNGMLRVCFDDIEILQWRTSAAKDFARGMAPTASCMSATMTGLRKNDGGVGGINTGTSLHQHVQKKMARQLSQALETACAPFPVRF